MKSNAEVQALVDRIEFPGLSFEVSLEGYWEGHGMIYRPFLRVIQADAVCSRTGQPMYAGSKGRKWRLSRWMTDQEIVGTAFAAVKAWHEHEISEQFKFDGVSVYDFHTDVHALVALRQRGGLDERSDESAT